MSSRTKSFDADAEFEYDGTAVKYVMVDLTHEYHVWVRFVSDGRWYCMKYSDLDPNTDGAGLSQAKVMFDLLMHAVSDDYDPQSDEFKALADKGWLGVRFNKAQLTRLQPRKKKTKQVSLSQCLLCLASLTFLCFAFRCAAL